jgi:hypothetical protein
MIFLWGTKQTVRKRKRTLKLGSLCHLEELESRCLLTATVLDEDLLWLPWSDSFGNEPGYAYDTKWGGGSYQVLGNIQWSDADYLYIPMTPGDTVELTVSAPTPDWMLTPVADDWEWGVHAWTETTASGDPGGATTSDSNANLSLVTASSHVVTGEASAAAESYAEMTPSLVAGTATASASASATDAATLGASAEARAVGRGDLSYTINRSGVLNVSGDVWGWVKRAEFEIPDANRKLVYDIGISAAVWVFSTVPPTYKESYASGSWTFTPDEFTPTAAIVDFDGNILAESDSMGHLKFTQTSLGPCYLVVAHDRQYTGAVDSRYDFNFLRPYQVDVELTAAEITLGVTAQFDELPDSAAVQLSLPHIDGIQVTSDNFGPYLPNVDLPNTFNVLIDGNAADYVTSVTWQIGTHHGNATRVANSHNWTFSSNMADYTAGTKDLIVSAFNANGVLMEEYHGAVVHLAKLNFELQVDPGASDSLTNVEDARFFMSIAANLKFQGTIDELATFYHDKTQVYVGNTPVAVSYQGASVGALTTFTFSYDVGTLSPGPSGTIGVDVEINRRSIQSYGDDKEWLRAVARPTWLAAAGTSYNSTDGEYEFRNLRPSLLSYNAVIKKTGQAWLDRELKKLESFTRLQAELNIDAPLQTAEIVDFSSSKLIAEANLLGQQVWKQTYASSDLRFEGSLNSITLDPAAMSVRLKTPIPLANETFLDKSFDVNLISKLAPQLPDWLLSARFALGLKIMGSLTVDGGIMLSKVGSTVQYVSGGTFIQLNAIPQVESQAKIAAKVAGGWLVDFEGSTTCLASLDINCTARYSGSIYAAPAIASISVSAQLTLAYRIQVKGTLAKSMDFVDYDSAAPENGGPGDDIFGPYELLALKKSRGKGR